MFYMVPKQNYPSTKTKYFSDFNNGVAYYQNTQDDMNFLTHKIAPFMRNNFQ